MSHLDAYSDTPLFVLHGTADRIVPPRHIRDIVAAFKDRNNPVEYHETPGLGHDDRVAEGFQEEIFRFFESGITE